MNRVNWPSLSYSFTLGLINEGPVWNTWLDYPGGHTVHLHTSCGWSVQKREEQTWHSYLNLSLVHEPAVEQYWGNWWREIYDQRGELSLYSDWIRLMGTELPILGKREYCYESEGEAKQGHQKLVYYLEQFMIVRRLFDDIVEEMQQKRHALLEEVGLLHLAQHL